MTQTDYRIIIGGYANLGEEISSAGVREVYEETGIRCEFVDVLSFRHSHNIQFGRSDVYVIGRFRATSYDIVVDDEIDDAKWINIHEFRKEITHPLLVTTVDMILANVDGMKESIHPSIVPKRSPYRLYLPHYKNKTE